MEIKGVDRLLGLRLPAANRANRASKNEGFKEILDQKIPGANAPSQVKGVDTYAAILDRGNAVLALLDNYAGKLADTTTSLKDIQPLVERIGREAHLMESDATALNPDSQGLDRLLREVAVAANVAVLKFERGDYI